MQELLDFAAANWAEILGGGGRYMDCVKFADCDVSVTCKTGANREMD